MSENHQQSAYSKKLFWWIFAAMLLLVYMTNSRRTEPVAIRRPALSEIRDLEKLGEELSIQIPLAGSSTDKQPEGVARSVSSSIKWLNRSIESLNEKLKRISDKLENTQDNAIVEAEIKRAFVDAFVGSSDPVGAAEVTVDAKEVAKNETQSGAVPQGVDLPVLGDGVPDWVRQRVIEEDRILIPVESSMHGTLEECRAELATRLPGEVKQIIDECILRHASSESLPGLTSEYINDNLIDRALEFDNYQERPSGNFHQLWVRLDIDKKAMDQIREWEREQTTTSRVWILGGFSLAFLGSFAGLSKVFQFLSIREKNRNRVRQTA